MKIALGCDHGGLELKNIIKSYLLSLEFDVVDFGTNSQEAVAYPVYGYKVGNAVVKGEVDRGIVICGTGIGISIAANKIDGVRCALVSETLSARLTALHNDTNVLALGGRIIGSELAKDIVYTWLTTEYEGGRHQSRLDMIEQLEKGSALDE